MFPVFPNLWQKMIIIHKKVPSKKSLLRSISEGEDSLEIATEF